MKAFYYNKYGGPNVDKLGTIKKPSANDLKPGEMLLEVHAGSLNPVDYKQRGGGVTRLLLTYPLPRVHGFDFAGRVIGLADDVDSFNIDDMVFGMCKAVEKGSIAEFMIVKASVCVTIPQNTNILQAVSIPLVGITSMLAFRKSGIKENSEENANKRVLILGGAGGVGTCAIQLAKGLYNCGFVATTASPGAKTELCRELGADLVINYREDPKLKVLEEEEGFDFIYDTVGSLQTALPFVKDRGSCVSIAIAPTVEGLREWVVDSGFDILSFGVKNLFFSSFGKVVLNRALGASSIRSKLKNKKASYDHVIGRGNGELMIILKEELKNERLKAVIDKTYSLDEAKEAMKYLESGRATGKVVIQIQE